MSYKYSLKNNKISHKLSLVRSTTRGFYWYMYGKLDSPTKHFVPGWFIEAGSEFVTLLVIEDLGERGNAQTTENHLSKTESVKQPSTPYITRSTAGNQPNI